jgi:electron transfer flavoprotein alpha subunit
VSVLVLVEHDEPVSLEALALARRLGGELAAVAFGDAPAEVGAYGVTRLHRVVDERLGDYAPEAWGRALAELIERERPSALVAAGTDRGNEVLAHAAARLGVAFAAACVDARPDGDALLLTRQRWGGSLLEEARLSGAPWVVGVAPHAIAAQPAETPVATEVVDFVPSLGPEHFRARVVRREEPEAGVVPLEKARVVVGGGRGVGSAEGFAVLEELAGLLDGVVAGSRVVTNLGWRPHADQVGQTGARIAPELYIACGVSGAIQHMVGCRGAKRILAINKDKDAPLVARADYAVIGDLHEVVPAIVAELRARHVDGETA